MITPIEIGTSMLVRPRRSADNADEKKILPEYRTAGNASAAEIQWKACRVPPSAPDQTDTDRSMMFIAQNPATASARTSREYSGSR